MKIVFSVSCTNERANYPAYATVDATPALLSRVEGRIKRIKDANEADPDDAVVYAEFRDHSVEWANALLNYDTGPLYAGPGFDVPIRPVTPIPTSARLSGQAMIIDKDGFFWEAYLTHDIPESRISTPMMTLEELRSVVNRA